MAYIHLLWNYNRKFRFLMSAFSTVTKNTLLEHQVLTWNFVFVSFKFPLLLPKVTVQNTILQFLTNYFCQKLTKFEQNGLIQTTKNWIFWEKHIVSPIFKTFLHVKQIMMLRVLMIRFPTFIIPKITVV